MEYDDEHEDELQLDRLAPVTAEIADVVLDRICPVHNPAIRSEARPSIIELLYELDWTVSDSPEDVVRLAMAHPSVRELTQELSDQQIQLPTQSKNAGQSRSKALRDELEEDTLPQDGQGAHPTAASAASHGGSPQVVPMPQPTLQPSSNSEAVLRYVIVNKMGYKSVSAFGRDYPDELDAIRTKLADSRWGKDPHRLLLDEQQIDDVAYVANSMYKKFLWRLLPEHLRRPAEASSTLASGKRAIPPGPEADAAQTDDFRMVDDDALSAEVLDLLKRDRWRDYTYNQVATELGVHYKNASRVLRKLSRGSGIEGIVGLDKVVNGQTRTVFQYVPERAMYRHPENRSKLDIMCRFIGELLAHDDRLCQKDITEKARLLLGGADDHLVRDALRMMVAVGVLREEKGRNFRTQYSVNADVDEGTKKQRKAVMKNSPEFRRYYVRSRQLGGKTN